LHSKTLAYLIQDETGQPLTYFSLRSRFDKARELAKVSFQFRDIRAKAATDTGDLAHYQKLLAHKNRDMTEHYVRSRVGERVPPLR
jgi:integrase